MMRKLFTIAGPLIRSLKVTSLLACLALPITAPAATEWPIWTLADPTDTVNPRDALGTFSGGRSVIASLNVSSFKAAGTLYTSDPAIPGTTGNGNPPYILAPTGMPGGSIANGDVIATFDLSNFPVDNETVVGIADMVETALYRLELLDGSGNPLSLDGLLQDDFNLFYPPPPDPPLTADYNIVLERGTGLLSVDATRDANNGSTYRHSGLTLFSNLPSETEIIRILSAQDQGSEGVQYYFGGSVIPLPGAAWLLLSALSGLAFARRKRDTG